MKVHFEAEEWYPVYKLCSEKTGDYSIDIPEEIIKKYKQIMKDFEEMQWYIRSAIDKVDEGR